MEKKGGNKWYINGLKFTQPQRTGYRIFTYCLIYRKVTSFSFYKLSLELKVLSFLNEIDGIHRGYHELSVDKRLSRVISN